MSTSIRRLILVVLGALVAAMMSAQAAPPDQVCEKVLGKVLLIPEQPGTCTIDDGSGDYLGNPTPQAQPGCFTITLRGGLRGTGYAGVTREPLLSLETNGVISTPVVAVNSGRLIQTARAELQVRGTTLFTNDIVLIVPDPSAPATPLAVTEQVVLVGTDGRGSLAGATGNLTILGNSIGSFVPYVGEICREISDDDK